MVLLESMNIPLGTEAQDFSLMGIDDRTHKLGDYKDLDILVLVFMCNHCPYVQAIWGRLVDLQEKYKDKSVQFVGINPNKHPDYPEEDLEKMKEYAEEYGMNFPYLLDETQEVAKNYKAQCTPDIYVFDKECKLAYHGRIDDNWKDPENVKEHELDDALNALVNNGEPNENQSPSMGCSIKWRD